MRENGKANGLAGDRVGGHAFFLPGAYSNVFLGPPSDALSQNFLSGNVHVHKALQEVSMFVKVKEKTWPMLGVETSQDCPRHSCTATRASQTEGR